MRVALVVYDDGFDVFEDARYLRTWWERHEARANGNPIAREAGPRVRVAIWVAGEIAEQGTFTGFKDAASGAELNAFFIKDKAAREQ